ncbi:MAG: hypothetical protein HY951_11910 [Bacteroidia bacterium]|nr:hypothetical protein [Bacteroidia bacterium]
MSRPYLYFSIVDLSYNNGLGKVTTKNSLLYNTNEVAEKLIAVRHANGRDWWLIFHQRNTDVFVKYLILNDVILGPFTQVIGSAYTSSFGGDMGEMVASADGDKIVATNLWGVIDLFDFDRCTGTLSNWVDLGYNHFINYSGCAFSPKGNRLYITQADSLFQFDLTATSIVNSRQTIWVNPYPNDHDICQMQLGPDGKIYIANVSGTSFPNTIFDTINMNLSVINEPNGLGTACYFQPNSFYLGGRRSYAGLPNMPNYNLGALEGSPCDTITQVESIKIKDKSGEALVFPNPAREFLTVSTQNSIQGASISISDLFGVVVYEECVQQNTN